MHAAQRLLAHRHADGAAEVDGLHAADHAVGGFHGHGAHAALAQVLLHLEDDADGRGHGEAVAGDAQRLVDGRHRRFFKLHVYRGTGNLNYLADVLCHKLCFLAASSFKWLTQRRAPLTISMISLVMAAWRTRFICSVRRRSCPRRCWLPNPSPSCAPRARRRPTPSWRDRASTKCTAAAGREELLRRAARRCSRRSAVPNFFGFLVGLGGVGRLKRRCPR